MPRDQIVLFATSLEERIPDDHPVRLLDEILDQLDWSDWEAEYHGALGQPPIHPSVLAKTLLFALIRRIRSSRQIEYNLHHSIDFMWLASGRTIDHVTLSEFRRKHQKQLKKIYRRMVQRRPLGLRHGEPVSVGDEPLFQHPLRLAFFLGNSSNDPFVQARGQRIGLDRRNKTLFVF